MSPILHLLVLCFTLLQLGHTATVVVNIYPVYTYCPNPTCADPVPYAFQSNLQKLLSDLSSAANSSTNTRGFSSATAGNATSYPLFGIFLCGGDVPSNKCASCVDRAATDLYDSCSPPNQEAIIWYNLCMIKYSNTSFVSKLDVTLGNAFRRIKTVDGNLTAFDNVLGGVASKVEEEAANGDGQKRFATGEGIVNQSMTVYVLGQCTPDLSAADCRHCLGECNNILRTYCENRRGGLALYASCNLRYETYPFYYYSDSQEHSAGSSSHSSGGNEPQGNPYIYNVENIKNGIFPTGKEQSEQLLIDCGVLVTTILLFWVFVLGSLRRRVYGSSPGGWILVFHSLIAILIPFLLGLMRSASHPHKSFTIWACYLLFAYGGFDTMTARNLTDNDNSTSYFLYTFSLLFGIVYVAFAANKNIVDTQTSIINLVLYIILVCLSAWNVIDTMGAFRSASKSKGLPEACKQTEHHMCNDFIDNKKAANEEEATGDDVASMRGYSYLVDVGNEKSKAVNTTEVWECLNKLFKSPTDDGEDTRGHMRLNNSIKANKAGARLKDICLSRALFNILLMRCAGHTMQERSRNKSRSFVEDGLLSVGDPQKTDFKRVFTIVEWELEFLFDFFYTKFYYHSTKRSAFKFRRLVILAIFMWFAIYELHQPSIREDVIGPSIIQYHGHSVPVGIARTAILLIAIVEAVQLSMLIFSNWTIVKLICLYSRRSHTKRNTLIKVQILFFSFVKYYLSARIDKCLLSSCMFNPWRRKLGQYSLLENYDKVPMLHRLLLCYAPRVSQKESHAVKLSSKVKRATVSLLAEHGFTLSCGKASLARNGLADQLSSFCSTEPEGDAYVILVWHIATSVCEHHFSSKLGASSKQKGEDFIVATQLSKYCAYLVIFAPELLSGVPYKTHTTVLDTIKRAHELLKDSKGIGGRCSKLVEPSRMGTQDNTLFGRATVLVNHLRDLFSGDSKRGWKVLAEFWVELILYLAPTENAIAHAEHLAKGGEFITLLWALLTNAGITSRAHFPTTVSV